jgi:uncharacterized membrane protein
MDTQPPLRSKLKFPDPFQHRHPPIQDVNDVFQDQLTAGQRAADGVAKVMGSWLFIIVQTIILLFWLVFNIVGWVNHWDPYPFILMNLVLSTQAAYAAPIIMMSQNRQAAKDRLEAHNDYQINQKAEAEIPAIFDHLEAQNKALAELHGLVIDLRVRIADLERSQDKP